MLEFLCKPCWCTVIFCALVSLLSEEKQTSRPPSGENIELEDQEEEVELKEMEEHTPLVALAPDASLPEMQAASNTDISSGPAFHCLDEV